MTKPLDRIDRKILRALLENGRLSNAELSEKVGLSPSPCWQRVKRLEDEGVIRGYTAILDQAKLAFAPQSISISDPFIAPPRLCCR